MKVLMTCPYSMSRPGGVQGQILGLARELRKLDVDTRIVAPCDGPPPDPSVISVGPSVEWESNGSIAPIAPGRVAARRTVEAVRSLEPDVVHLHEPAVPGPCLSTLLGYRGPMVGTFHAAGELLHQWSRPAFRSVMQHLTFRVVVSEAARETAIKNWGDDYLVLFNGIETERILAVEPALAPRPAVLFIGRLEPRKGLAVLLDAWRGIERDADLWVIGDGPQSAELRAKRVPNVEWLGTASDHERNARLRGATVFCAPSISGESFGIVLLEAMAAQTPIVASAIDGYQNVARPDMEALLVPPGDVAALQTALRRVLDDEPLRARLVGTAIDRAAEFSMKKLALQYLALYEQALVPTA